MKTLSILLMLPFLLAACALSGRTVQMMQADCQAAASNASFPDEWTCIKRTLDQSVRHKSPALRHWTAQYQVFGETLSEIVEAGRMDDATAKISLLEFANQLDRDILAVYAAGVPTNPLSVIGKALSGAAEGMRSTRGVHCVSHDLGLGVTTIRCR